MKKEIVFVIALLGSKIAGAGMMEGYKLPENGKIKVATLTGSYSCKDAGPFTVLNLNGETYDSGNYYPELQINFSCSSKPSIEGTDLSTIAQIGEVPLEEMDTYTALPWYSNSSADHNFTQSAPIIEGMTYSVILNTFKYRGQLVFRVISYKSNILTIEYVTRSYALITETSKSTFIDYKALNFR